MRAVSLVRSSRAILGSLGLLLTVVGCSSEPMPMPDASGNDSGSSMDSTVDDSAVVDSGADTGVMMDTGVSPADSGVGADADAATDAAPARCAAGVDSDGDGLANDVECALMTDPYNPDTDMDGLSDGAVRPGAPFSPTEPPLLPFQEPRMKKQYRRPLLPLAAAFFALNLGACGSGPNGRPDLGSVQGVALPLGADPNIGFFGDFFQGTLDFTFGGNDNPLADPALTAVTRDLGPTVIDLKTLPFRSGKVDTGVQAWSSWWFPKREDVLFKDKNSALRKYDYLADKWSGRLGVQKPPSAAEFEAQQYNANSQLWEGLCDAWAIASITSAEPKKPQSWTFDAGIFNKGTKIEFSIGELKALLLMTYANVDTSGLKIYGQRFTGDENSWIYPDIFPDQFHRFVVNQIFEKRQPFIMDHDAGVEVWNVPVYAANYLVSMIDKNSLMVRMFLYTADSAQTGERDFVGTKELLREYNYVLTGTTDAQQRFTVTGGYWTVGPTGVNSRHDHPDYVIAVDRSLVKRAASNPGISIPIVDEILKGSI